jgi:fibronectin-binding autotransporter adhesin
MKKFYSFKKKFLTLILVSIGFSTMAQQTVFWRDNAANGNFENGTCADIGTPPSQWWYPSFTPNNARNRPDCFDGSTTRHNVNIDNNHQTTMTTNTAFWGLRSLTFVNTATTGRTINSSPDDNTRGISLTNGIYHNGNTGVTHTFNTRIGIDASPIILRTTTSGATSTYNREIFGNANNITFDGAGATNATAVISGAGASITKNDAGTLTFSGASANTYTGTTTVNGGTLVLNKSANVIAIPAALTANTGVTIRTDAANQWGTGTPPLVTLNGTAIFNLNNNNQRVALASASSTASVTLGSATLNIDNTGTDTYAGTITGTGGLTKTSSGTQILSNTGNSYTGATTITGGILRLGAAGVIADASNVVMNGGTLSTGAAAGFAETMGTLALTASSTLALGTGSHNVTFAASNAVAWTANTILTVTGWTGTNNGNSSGTAGRLFVGNGFGGLTGVQLSRIRFNIGATLFGAMQLSTGEIVPSGGEVLYYGGATGTWTGSLWSVNEAGPYTTAWTSGRHAIFNIASANTLTFATTNVAAITYNENCVFATGGTLGFGPSGGAIAPIYVENGRTLNLVNGINFSTAAGSGFIKNGNGVFISVSANATGVPAGVTLNSGVLGIGGSNTLGSGTLTINGGAISASTGTARSPVNSSIVVNNNFQFGDLTNLAAGTGNLTFSATVALGSSVTRTITLGNTGTYSLNGVISGTSSNLVLAATAAGTLSFGAANTYGGNTTINGGTLQCGIANTLPSTTNVTLANTAGATLNLNNFAQTIASLSGGGATGGNIVTGGASGILTVNQSTNTTYAGVMSGAGALTKTGSGTLTLSGANTYTGLTTITAGTLQLGAANVIAAGNVVLNGGTLSTGATTGFSETVGTLDLNANSIISLGTGVHSLTFANSSAVTWAGTTLTINGWTGTAGSSGTAGRIFFGNTTGTLTGAQLAKISFAGFPGTPILLGTGELVPPVPPVTYTWNGSAGDNNWATTTNWTPSGNPGAGDHVIIPVATGLLNITGAQSVINFTLSGTGSFQVSSTGSLTVTGTLTNSSSAAPTFNCASTFTVSSAGQTIPAWNYGNLVLSGSTATLASSGTIGICGNYTPSATTTVTGSTVNFNGTTAQNILTSAAVFNNFTVSNTTSTVTSGVNVTINGTGNINASAVFIQTAGTFAANAVATTVNGTLRTNGTGAVTGSAANLIFSATGTYNHNRDAGAMPTATWNSASTLSVTGQTSTTAPTNFAQSLGNFTWNSAGMTGTVALASFPTAINGAWTISGTNNQILGLSGINATYTCNLTVTNNSRVYLLNTGAASTLTVNDFTLTTNASSTLGWFMNNSATASAAATFTVNGNLLINSASASALTWGNTASNTSTINVGGNFTNTLGTITGGATATNNLRFITAGPNTYSSASTFTISNVHIDAGTIDLGAGGMNLTATLNVNNGGTLQLGTGNITNSGAINVNNGGVINSNSTGSISNTLACLVFTGGTLNLNSTGNLSNGGAATIQPGATISFASTAYCTSGGSFTCSGTIITANVFGINSTGTLVTDGSVRNTAGFRNFNTTTNYTYNGSAPQVTGTAIMQLGSSNNLTINNTAGVTLSVNTILGASGVLTLSNGILNLGTFNLTLNNTAVGAISGGSASSYVVANSTGQLIRAIATAGYPLAYNFTVGDASNYSPVSLNFATGGTARNIGVRVFGTAHPSNASPTDFANRYWAITNSEPTGSFTYTPTFTIVDPGDIGAGAFANMKINRWNGTAWTEYNASPNTTFASPNFTTTATLNQTSIVNAATNEFALRLNNPILTYTWDGSFNSDWATAANWDLNAVPTNIDNVVIPTSGSYLNSLDITGTRTVNDFTVNGDGTFNMSASSQLTINGNYTYSSSTAATFDCSSTFILSSSAAQTLPAANYGNLDLSGGNRVLANSGTIGICGTFTRGAGSYTVTGSTVNYNGTGAQTIAIGTYNNLTISNSRGAAVVTLPAGTIAVGGTFDVSSYASSTNPSNAVNASSIFDFTSAGAQPIPAFFYGQLNNTGNGNRTWAASGTIDINQGFAPGTGIHTITGSTVRYSATTGTYNLATFTTNVTTPARLYNNLIFNGTGGTWTSNGITLGIAGNLNVTAGTFVGGATPGAPFNGGSTTINIDGNFTLDGGTFNLSSSSTATNSGTINLLGNFNLSAGLFNKSGTQTGTFNFSKPSLTQTISQSGGTITNNGTTWFLGTGSTTQTVEFSTNVAMSGGSVVARNNATVRFNATSVLSGTTTFTTSTGTTLRTANPSGFNHSAASGSVQCSTRPFNVSGVNYYFDGTSAQFTGTALNPANLGQTIANLTIDNPTTVTLSSFTGSGGNGNAQNAVIASGTVTLTNGVLILDTRDLQINGSFAGSFSSTAMVATIGTTRSNGRIVRTFPTGTQSGLTYTYPLGDITGTVQYTPISISNLSYTSAGSPFVAFKVKDAKAPFDPSIADYLTRYWEVSTGSSFTSPVATGITFTTTSTYITGSEDVVGNDNLFRMSRFSYDDGSVTDDATGSCGSGTLVSAAVSASNLFNNHDLYARVAVPIYFRSAATGIWENPANWSASTDINFSSPTGVTPSVYPIHSNSAGIRIMNTHIITTTTPAAFFGVPLDETTVDVGGTLAIGTGSIIVVQNGTGTDLVVNGTLLNQSGNPSLAVGTIQMAAGSVYNHAVNSGNVPTCTWDVGSECRITGVGASQPSGLGQSFSDFTWSCTSQSANVFLASALTTVGRDLNLQSTNGFNLSFTSTTALALTVGRDLNISGGFYNLVSGANANAVSMSVTGNMNLSGTGTFGLTSTGATGAPAATMSVGGNLVNGSSAGTSLSISVSSKSATLNVTGNYTQNNGGTINLAQGSGTGIINVAGTSFTLTSGTINMNNASSGVSQINLTNASSTFNVNGGVINTIAGTTAPATRPLISLAGSFSQTNGNIDFSPSYTGTLNPPGEIQVAGNFTRSGTGYIRSTLSTNNALIAFNGTNQTYNTTGVSGNFLYTNINVNSGSTLNLASDLALSNTTTPAQTVTVNGRLNCGTNLVSGALTTATAFTLNTSGTLSIGSLAGITTAPTATGNIQTGVRNFNAGTYIYAGANNQVTGNGLPASVAALQVANTGSSPNNVVTLTNTTSSTGALTFASGILDLAANNFTAGSVAGAGLNQYVRTSSTGVLRQIVGATQVTFPVGNTAYNPFQITNSGTSDTYGVRVLDIITSPAPNDPDLLINRYWVVNEALAGGSNLAVTAQYNSGEEGINFAAGTTLKIGLFPVSSWVENNASSSGVGPFVVSSGANFTAVGTYGVGKDLGFINPSTTYTWVGNGAAGDWTDPNNWNPNTSAAGPLPGDNIIINAPGTAGNNLNLNITRTISDVTFNGTGSMTFGASGNLTINGNVTYGGSFAATLNCGSTINYANPAALTIPPFNYGNLVNANSSVRIWTASATTGICGTLTTGTGSTFTAGAGSTVNYNGTGAQTIVPLNYANLSISNNRGTANLTSPAGTIAVTGTFDVSTLSNFTPVVNASSIFDFTSAGAQTIPAFFYGQLNNTGNGNRTWANSGVIDIAQGFTPSTATNTITGSSVRYSNTDAVSWNLTTFTTNVANRHYNNVEFVGGATTSWTLSSGLNLGCTGNLSLTGAGTLNVANNATANTMNIDGNLTLSGSGNIRISTTATATVVGTLNVTGNTTISNGVLTGVASGVGTTVQGNLVTNNLDITGTGQIILDAASNTANSSITVNGNLNVTSTTANAINFGSGTNNANNVFNLKGNLTKSGTGTFGCSGTFAPSSGFFFNLGSGTQTYSYAGAAITVSNFTVAASSTLQLLTNMVLGSNASASTLTIIGTLDAGSFTVTPGNPANNAFALQAGATLSTNNAGGISGTISGFTNANTSWASGSPSGGANFIFTGNNVNTGFSGYTNILNASASNSYNITWNGTGTITMDKTMYMHNVSYNSSGRFYLNANNLTISSTGTLSGSPFSLSKMFVVTSGSLIRSVQNTGAGLPFTWPIGEETGTAEYSPVSVNSITGAGVNGSIGFNVVDGIQPNNSPAISYITRYWPTTVTGFNVGYTLSTLTFNYEAADIVVGPEASLRGNSYSTAISDWTQYASSSCASNVLTITSGVGGANMPTNGTYDITARIDVPVYYRTVNSGPWQTLTNWEVSSDPAFISPGPSAAIQAPNNINSEGITIRNTHAITTASTIVVDNMTIESGGSMTTTNNNFTVANGTGTDLTVNSGGTLQFSSASNNSLVVNAGALIQVNGLMIQSSTASPDVSNSGTINIGATGTYEHARNAGIIPTCSWASGSICLVSGVGNNMPSGLGQSFHHFTVNTTLTASVNCSANLTTINGDFNLTTNHATNEFRLSTGTTYTLTVGGNFNITNSFFSPASGGAGPCNVVVNGVTTMNGATSRIDKSGAATVNYTFNGDYTQNAGTFDFNSAGSSNTTVNFRGNVIWNGSILRTNGGTHIINFDKSTGLQTLTCGATFGAGAVSWNIGNSTTNTVRLLSNLALNNSLQNFTVNNGAIFDCGAFILTGGNTSFVLSATGGLKSGNVDGIYNAPAAQGSIQTLSRTYPGTASYFYNGTINQITGNGLPNTLITTGNINIENTGIAGSNTVTLLNDNTTTPTLNLISGLFAAGTTQQINITTGGTVNASGGNFATGVTAGLLNFPGTGTFTGSCSPYNVHIAGGVNFGAGTVTIQNAGRLRILAGGFVNTNSPAYAIGSTLEYNTGSNYDRGAEWSTASGKGFPHHVAINTSTLNPARTGASFAATTFNTGGNLNVTASGNIYMDFGGNNMTVPLIVNGDLTLVGQLSGSASVGGDIRLRGNWINNGSATNNYFPNSRAVFFDGTVAQTIGGTNTGSNPFAFVFIDNTAGVTLLRSQTINNQLAHTNGLLSLGNFDLTMSPGSTITGANSARYTITDGTGRLIQQVVNGGGDKVYPIGTATSFAPVTLNQGNTTDNIGVRVKTAPAFLPVVNDNDQMVNFTYNMNEAVGGANNLTTRFQWNGSDEAAMFVRTSTVYHGDWDGSQWQVRAASATAGVGPYTSTAAGFIGTLANREFVVGNINGIRDCYQTAAPGDWNTGTTWVGGNVPLAEATICISHAVTVNSVDPNTVTALTFNPSGSLTVSSGRTISIVADGTIANNSGSVQNLSSGNVILLGNASIGGTESITFNDLDVNGAATINVSPTVNGTLSIGNAGFINSNSIIYGPSSTLRYIPFTSYNVSTEWTGNGTVAGLGIPANVNLANGVTLNMPNADRGCAGSIQIVNGTLVLNPGSGDLYVGGDWIRQAIGNFTPNNRAVFFNGSGTQTISYTGGTESFPYLFIQKPSGTLGLTSNVDVTGTSGTIFGMTNTGSFDLGLRTLTFNSSGGNINANGGVANITGTGLISISGGTKTITSTSGGTFNFGPNVTIALNSGLDFGNSLSTVNGTLQIANGGFVSSNPPTYSNTSTLRYFSGTNYGRGAEWSSTSGPGYPHNVTIDFNGTPTTLDLGNGGSAIRQIGGNLTINDGGSLTMNATPMTNYLGVLGNVTIGSGSSGSLILSSSVGGDLQVGGNLTRNAGATFSQNSREVTMNGSTIQDINNVTSFNFLKIENSGSSVRLNANIDVVNRLWLNNGTLNLNGNNLNMANGSKIRRSQTSATMSAAPTIAVSEVVDMEYNGTLTTGNEFINDQDKIRDVEITTGTLTLNGNRTINRDLILSGGDLNLSTFTFTDRGRAVAPAFAGSITVSGGGTRLITGAVGCSFDVTGLGTNQPTWYTKTVSTFGGTLLSFDSDVLLRVGDGSIDFGAGNPTTVNGTLQILLGGSVGQILNPCNYATNSTLRISNTVDYIVGVNDKTWAAGAINSGNAGIPFNVEILDAGTDLRLEDTRSLRGSLTITNGSFSLNYVGLGTFSLGGNWTRTGATSAFNDPTNKKIIFDRQAAGNQSITTGSGVTAETFYDLEISPALGDVIATSGTAINVTNNLNFISGKFILNGTNLITLGNASSNGSITGVNSSRYLVTYSGGNTSTLKRFTNTNSIVYNFPVGDGTNYTPIDLTLYSGATPGSFISGSVTASAHPQIGVTLNRLNRYWSMEQSGLSAGFGYGVDFSYVDADIFGSEASIYPYKWTPGSGPGTGWIGAGGSNASFQMGTGSVNLGANTMHWEGIYSFSDITGNGGGTPLPITLLNFDAKKNGSNTDISWSTLSEINNDFFTVERTIDGVNFVEIAKVDGAGNHNGILNYSAVDKNPVNGKNYYRLKQTDFDGKFEYSKLVMVEFEGIKVQNSVTVYPNPSNGNNVNVSISGTQNKSSIQIKVSSSNGAEVLSINTTAINEFTQIPLETSSLANGVYYLQVIVDGTSTIRKLVITNR